MTMTNHEQVHLFLAVSLLHRHGYEVLCIAVHVDEGIVAQLEQTSGFQLIYNGNNDGRRLELDVNQICGEAFAELKQRIMDVVARRHPGHEVRGMVALRSEVGCAEQPAHTDYLQEGPSSGWYDWDTDSVPLSCIVALQDGTELNVWPEAIRFNWTRPYNRQRLVLNRGDVVVFRGDLVHAGVAYGQPNHRIHCFLELREGGYERVKEKDGTERTMLMFDSENIVSRGRTARVEWV